MLTRILWAAAAVISLSSCDSRPREWKAFVYPDAEADEHIELVGFRNFESCQQSAINTLRGINRAETGSYECGYRCGPNAEFGGIQVCKETRR